jgi:uncharacterized Zn finger protein
MARKGNDWRYRYDGWGGYPPYVSVAERKKAAAKEIAALAKKGKKVSPVVLEGTAIARTFWGKAWCKNLERYSDYANRIPRGRSYVRSGAVVDLQVEPGKVVALVRGSALYTVTVTIKPVEAARWREIVKECTGKIDSVIELLRGKLSKAVMEVITQKETGLFPAPRQIEMRCSCPDAATMCKHVAATLYGVGARLDHDAEMLFRLRGADPAELVTTAAAGAVSGKPLVAKEKTFGGDLAGVFGIDLDAGPAPRPRAKAPAAKPVLPVAPPKAARAKRTALAAPPPTISGAELSSLRVPPATVQYWLKTGVLGRTEVRGVYLRTPVAEQRLERFRAV